MFGSCHCKNIEIRWQIIDFSLVPRACQCEYCRSRSAAWVSKSGSRFVASIRNGDLHRVVTHGSGNAHFHECTHCGDPVFVTAEIDGELYGVLNANCLYNPQGFGTPVATDFGSQSPGEKLERWRSNWCYPVHITELKTQPALKPFGIDL